MGELQVYLWNCVTQIGTWTHSLLIEITHLVSGLKEAQVLNEAQVLDAEIIQWETKWW